MTEQQTTTNLEVLEDRAEKALEKAETGWREFAEAMREIKERSAHEQAGYRHFGHYYTEVWRPRTGKALRTLERISLAAKVEDEIRGVANDVRIPDDYLALSRLNVVDGAEEKARIVTEAAAEEGGFRGNVLAKISERSGEGVIEKAEARGVPVPPEPKGKTPSEAAWLAMAEASRLIRGVEPADAARVESGKIAARYQEQVWELAEWTRLFAHEVAAYAEETLNQTTGVNSGR